MEEINKNLKMSDVKADDKVFIHRDKKLIQKDISELMNSEYINTAKAEAAKAVQTEGTTQTGNVTAEGEKQVQAVQAKGQEVINSIPEDFPTQMQSKLDKQQGTENAGKLLGVGNRWQCRTYG